MWRLLGYQFLLAVVVAAPAALMLSPIVYPWLPQAHWAALFVSLVLLVRMGRRLAAMPIALSRTGCWLGAIAGTLGSATQQYVMRLPVAQAAFAHQLPGVPAAAVASMLHLHVWLNGVAETAMTLVIYGLLGGLAVWWSGRRFRRPPEPMPQRETEPPRAEGQ